MDCYYKICIQDRNYTSWEIYETAQFHKIILDIDPIHNKLFSNDVFTLDNHNQVTVIHSTVKSGPPIPGVLVLADNKSYGRQKKTAGKKKDNSFGKTSGKLLYKCIPDDTRLPCFLIPYEIKEFGFSKVMKNIYVTFTFHEWNEKHPFGTLNSVIGSVDILHHFYEYQLYCKSLNTSIQKFQKDTHKALELTSYENLLASIKTIYPSIEDRTDQSIWHVFTIDPPNSQDFDDGFSIREIENHTKQLSIYISNVTIWMDVLHLWESFSRRISTIYLPDKKRPMLPTILSEGLCSLQEKVTRIALVMDIFIQDNEIMDIQYKNCFINVYKNYCYEDPLLLLDTKYQQLLETTQKLSNTFKYITHVRNSHETVCYLMIFMNYYCAKELIQHKTGIFRSTIIKREFSVPETVPEDVGKFMKIWNSASGQYIDGSEITDTRHDILDMDAYIHITSPIRRLVDLLNMIQFQHVTGLITLSENMQFFYQTWLNDIEYINITMRSIRKIQCDCTLLELCHTRPTIMEKEYDGYLFDKLSRNDGLFQFMVFLPELKLSSRITIRENLENFDCRNFKLYLFKDEENFKRKIRLHLL
jgi:exoribonuclease R